MKYNKMEDYTFISMLLKCIAEQDEQISAQEQTIAELHQEMEEMLNTYGTAELRASEAGD